MAGRKKKEFSTAPYVKPRTKRPKPYNRKKIETRGLQGKEKQSVKSFWREYTMDQVIIMTPEELDLAIDKYLDEFVERQIKNDRWWNFPDAIDFRKFR